MSKERAIKAIEALDNLYGEILATIAAEYPERDKWPDSMRRYNRDVSWLDEQANEVLTVLREAYND